MKYGKDEIPDDKFMKLAVLCLSSAIIEATVFWIVEKFNKRFFKGISIMDSGVELLLENSIFISSFYYFYPYYFFCNLF